jgi:hypothetical protein
MAITILPGKSVGTEIGTGLGSVLGGGLQNLANIKLQQLMQQQQQMRGIPGLTSLGFSPEQAQSLAALDPQLQREVVKQKLAGPSNELFAQSLSQALGGQGPMTQQDALMQALQGSAGQAGAQQQAPAQAQQQQQAGALNIPAGLKPQQALQLAQLGLQRQQVASKEARADQMAVDKETLPFYKDTIKQAHAAKNNDKRLNRMEELIKTGKLSGTGFNSLIKTLSHGIFGFGIDLSGLNNPESQEFEKLSNDFIKEAKEIFGGGRLTDADLAAYLKTVPTLLLSNEGKLRVMNNMRQFNEAAKIKDNALREVIKANGGKRPRNLEILVDEIAQPQIDALADQFKQSFQAPEDNTLVGSAFRSLLPDFVTRGTPR